MWGRRIQYATLPDVEDESHGQREGCGVCRFCGPVQLRGECRRHAATHSADGPANRRFRRRLVSARRYRNEQSKGQKPFQRAVRHGDVGQHGAQGLRQRTAVWSRHRLSVQQLDARGRDRRVSRQGELPRLRHRAKRRQHVHGRIPRQQVRVVVPRQRLCRSRHLVFIHAVHRRGHRRVAQHDQQLP